MSDYPADPTDITAARRAGGEAAAMNQGTDMCPNYRTKTERDAWFDGHRQTSASRRPVTHNEYE